MPESATYETPGPVEENWRDAISSVEEIIDFFSDLRTIVSSSGGPLVEEHHVVDPITSLPSERIRTR